MVGKMNVLKSHLLKGCQHIPSDVKIEVDRKVKEDDIQKTAPLTAQSSFSSSVRSLPTENEDRGPKRRKSSPSRNQGEFEGDLCNWFVACGVLWNAANNPQTRIFSSKWLSDDVVIPDRRILSGRILNEQAKKVEENIKVKVQGKLATGQCDGWKNVAKTSVVTTVMSVENEVC